MGKANPPLLAYTSKNLHKVTKSIWRSLTVDLLPVKKFVPKNLQNSLYGHCHTASGCLYKIFGNENVNMYRAMDKNGIYHWWVQDKNGFVIDLTWSQYSAADATELHKKGEKRGLLGFGYKVKVNTLLDRVRLDLKF